MYIWRRVHQTKNGQGWHANTGFMHAPYTGKIGAYLQDENLDLYLPRGRCPVAAAEPKGAILYLGTVAFPS